MSLINYSPNVIRVKDAEAEVWEFNMQLLHSQFHTLISYLTEDETERYKKLVDSCKRRDHMACRGLLRLVVSQYVSQDPNQIQFSYNPYGKPFVLCHPAYLFNLSHSGKWLSIIVSQNHEVGIDCEMFNDKYIGQFAKQILNPKDYAQLNELPRPIKTKQLIQAWTQKEAFIKAIGEGLFYQRIKDIHVDLSSSKNTSISNDYDGHSWITKTFTIWEDHITSICYKQGGSKG
jgi:4'-phosphopantetheinyl transferase